MTRNIYCFGRKWHIIFFCTNENVCVAPVKRIWVTGCCRVVGIFAKTSCQLSKLRQRAPKIPKFSLHSLPPCKHSKRVHQTRVSFSYFGSRMGCGSAGRIQARDAPHLEPVVHEHRSNSPPRVPPRDMAPRNWPRC